MSARNTIAFFFPAHEAGGTGRYFYHAAQALKNAGAEIEVFSVSPLALSSEANLKTRLIDCGKKKRGLLNLFKQFFCIFRAFINVFGEKKIKSIIILRLTHLWPIFVPALIFNVKIVLLVDDLSELRPSYKKSLLVFYFGKLTFCLFSKVIVFSQALTNDLKKTAGLAEKRITRISPPFLSKSEQSTSLISSKRRTLAERFSLPERWLFVVTTGEINNRKNFEILIRAIAACENEKIALFICGDGAERQAAQSIIVGLGLSERVVVTGWLDDIDEIIAACDLYVMSTTESAMSIALIEALSAGIAVIGADVSDIRELLGHENLIFRAQSVGALSEKLSEIATQRGYLDAIKKTSHEVTQTLNRSWGNDLLKVIEETAKN